MKLRNLLIASLLLASITYTPALGEIVIAVTQDTDTTNQTTISSALADRVNNKQDFLIPGGGTTRITGSIIWPAKDGYVLRGAGAGTDLNDNHYDPMADFLGGMVTRLVWRGGANDNPMIQYNGKHGVISDIHFRGRLETTTDPMAKIGIHCRTSDQTGFPTGKLTVRNCSFFNCQIGLLFGYGLDQAYQEAATYTGHAASHADESNLENVNFYYPDTPDTSAARTCMYVRNEQAQNFTVSKVTVWGRPNEVFYFERGAGLTVQKLSYNGGGTTLLRLGRTIFGTFDYRVYNDAVGFNTVFLDMDGHSGNYARMVNVSGHDTVWAYLQNGTPITPRYVCRGPCKVTIQNMLWVGPGCIQLVGQEVAPASGRDNFAWCHLQNVGIWGDGTWPEACISNTSSGPYLLTWSNCFVHYDDEGGLPNQGNYNIPIRDGYYINGKVRFITRPRPTLSANINDPLLARLYGQVSQN